MGVDVKRYHIVAKNNSDAKSTEDSSEKEVVAEAEIQGSGGS